MNPFSTDLTKNLLAIDSWSEQRLRPEPEGSHGIGNNPKKQSVVSKINPKGLEKLQLLFLVPARC